MNTTQLIPIRVTAPNECMAGCRAINNTPSVISIIKALNRIDCLNCGNIGSPVRCSCNAPSSTKMV